MALPDAAALLGAWFSQSSPQNGVGRDQPGMLDMNLVSGIHPLLFWGVRRPQNQRLPGWDKGRAAQPSPLAHRGPSSSVAGRASCFRAQQAKPTDPN